MNTGENFIKVSLGMPALGASHHTNRAASITSKQQWHHSQGDTISLRSLGASYQSRLRYSTPPNYYYRAGA
jgi:hypothetical protein